MGQAVAVPALAVRERLEEFMGFVTGGLARSEQRRNAALYARGLIEQGPRKSLEPLAGRLGEEADYESLQHFLADSPWDSGLLMQAVAELVSPAISPEAWVLDDTGFPKDGKRSPGVKRQYSGTLGKVGNCQLGVSLHAVGPRGTLPLGWALYLPEEWCSDPERRRQAKIPAALAFMTKPCLGVELVKRAAGFRIEACPVLGDQAYGDNTALRTELDEDGIEYVLAVNEITKAYGPETVFEVPTAGPGRGRPPTVARADREPQSLGQLAERLGLEAFERVSFRDGPDREPRTSRFAFVRVCAKNPITERHLKPRWEWLIVEWPEGEPRPSGYWLSNLPTDTTPKRLARLARLRWKIELDYKQLKGELGLDHYEGRSWAGWHHHTALVTAAHAFLTLERLNPKAQRPA